MKHSPALVPTVRRIAASLLVLLLFAATARAEDALKGVALVIGQSKYEHIPALPNPANDAREMAKLLTDLGFDARSVSDRDAARLGRDLERFVEDAEGADVAFLYYSGHGIESGGENWLVPVDADVSSLDRASESLVAISAVVDKLKSTVPVVVVLLDACRTNPFPADALVRTAPGQEGAPIGAGGLTPVRGAAALNAGAPDASDNLGTVIGFAAEPGHPALDGDTGGNSPYAAALLRHLGAMQGVEFGAVMRMVTEEVYLDTRAKQRPWVNESLRRMLYFGVAQDEPTGNDALITGERRKLLLTISELPMDNRAQVELVALRDAVPLDSLYGVLRAMGTEQIPQDPNELSRMLDAQAARVKQIFDRARALDTSDPETRTLLASADSALRQGAIDTARGFLDEAVGRVKDNERNVDDLEEELRRKRIADAAIYAQRADVAALAYDYAAAASDYRKAFELVEKWDEGLRDQYKLNEGVTLLQWGDAVGEEAAYLGAIDAFRVLLGYSPYGEKNTRWAALNTNIALALQGIGEHASDTDRLLEALDLLRASLTVFEDARDDDRWASTQDGIAGVLKLLGEREADPARLQAAIEAYRAALSKRDRARLPSAWADAQNNLGVALSELAERTGEEQPLLEAMAAFEAAQQVFAREANPLEWSRGATNLGNALQTLGLLKGDAAMLRRAVDAFEAVVAIHPQDRLPLGWASAQTNLGNAYNSLGKMTGDTDILSRAEAAYNEVLTVFTRESRPRRWAAVQRNLAVALQNIGQQTYDAGKLDSAVEAYRAALEGYPRSAFALEWATVQYDMGQSLKLLGQMRSDPAALEEALRAENAALEVFTRDETPRLWALARAAIGAILQSLAMHKGDISLFSQAADAQRDALSVLSREDAPIDWATAQQGLSSALFYVATFDRKPEVLPEALTAAEAQLEVFDRAAYPIQWAFGMNNVGDVRWAIATNGGGGLRDLERALEAFQSARAALEAAGHFAALAPLDTKIELLNEQIAKSKG